MAANWNRRQVPGVSSMSISFVDALAAFDLRKVACRVIKPHLNRPDIHADRGVTGCSTPCPGTLFRSSIIALSRAIRMSNFGVCAAYLVILDDIIAAP